MMKKRKVLVTEDTQEILDFISMVLEENGYEVLIAHDGEECMKRVVQDRPDMILMDVMMPRKSGYHTLSELRQKDQAIRNIPVIIMSGKRSVKELFSDWQFDGFLQKPFDSSQLLEQLEKTWKVRIQALGGNGSKPEAKAQPKMEIPKDMAKCDTKVLFVSRENFGIDTVRVPLNAMGFACLLISDGPAALNLAANTRISLILLDATVDREIINTEQLYEQLRSNVVTQNIPIAFFAEKSSFKYMTVDQSHKVIFYEDVPGLLHGIRQILKELNLVKLKAA